MTDPATREQLFAELDRLAIPHKTMTHPPVFTVEEAKALRGPAAMLAKAYPAARHPNGGR